MGCYIWYQSNGFQNDFWGLWGVSILCYAFVTNCLCYYFIFGYEILI